MKYLVIVVDKDNNPSRSTIEADDFLEAYMQGSYYCFERNTENGISELEPKDGYNVLAVIGEHPLINLGVK